MKNRITTKKVNNYYHFYLDGKDVTEKWMWFFSSLSMADEGRCEELFIKHMEK